MYNDAYASLANQLSGALSVIAVVALVFAVALIIAEWKLLEKAGQPGWKSLIPFYNTYILYQLCWSPNMYWLELGFTLGTIIFPVLSIGVLVLTVMRMIRLAAAFGKDGGYAVGLIFLCPVFIMILGFGSSTYVGASTFKDPMPRRTPGQQIPHAYDDRREESGSTVAVPVRQSNPDPTPAPAPTPKAEHRHPELKVTLKNTATGEHYRGKVITNPMIIGRSGSRAQLQLKEDPAVSGTHIELNYRKGKLYAKDISTNGTWVNGRKLTESTELAQNDELTLGRSKYTITWRLE